MPCAFVELKEGASAREADIISFCRSHMSGFKTPKAVVFGPIPKTSTGKIQKSLLRKVESAKAFPARADSFAFLRDDSRETPEMVGKDLKKMAACLRFHRTGFVNS